MAKSDAPPKKTTKELKEDDKNVTTDEDLVRKTRLEHSQCVLSSLFGNSNLVYNPRTWGRNAYKNFIILDSPDPSTMISLIHGIKEADEFFRMPTKLASHLVPKIRLFFLDSKGNKDEVLFSQSDTVAANPDSQLFNVMSGQNKGGDAGIVSVDVEDLTTQPDEEGNSLVAKIKLFFKTFEAFTNPKVASASGTKSYAELITRRDSRSSTFDPLDNRIQLHLGYNLPDVEPSELGITRSRYKLIEKAIYKSVRLLNLTLREHTFNFNEDGSIELDITYNAALDGIYRDMRTDLFQTHAAQKRVAEVSEKIQQIKKKKDLSDEDKENIERYAAVTRRIRAHSKDEAMGQFIETLFGIANGSGTGKTENKKSQNHASYMKVIRVPQELIGAIDGSFSLSAKNIKSNSLKQSSCKKSVAKHFNI